MCMDCRVLNKGKVNTSILCLLEDLLIDCQRLLSYKAGLVFGILAQIAVADD